MLVGCEMCASSIEPESVLEKSRRLTLVILLDNRSNRFRSLLLIRPQPHTLKTEESSFESPSSTLAERSFNKQKFSLTGQPKATSQGDIGLLQKHMDQKIEMPNKSARRPLQQDTKISTNSSTSRGEAKIYDSPVVVSLNKQSPPQQSDRRRIEDSKQEIHHIDP